MTLTSVLFVLFSSLMCYNNLSSGSQLWILHWNPRGTALQQGEAPQQWRQVGSRDSCQHTSWLPLPIDTHTHTHQPNLSDTHIRPYCTYCKKTASAVMDVLQGWICLLFKTTSTHFFIIHGRLQTSSWIDSDVPHKYAWMFLYHCYPAFMLFPPWLKYISGRNIKCVECQSSFLSLKVVVVVVKKCTKIELNGIRQSAHWADVEHCFKVDLELRMFCLKTDWQVLA